MKGNEPATKKLSFIIPVYNAEKYLSECLDSVLCQLTPECEVILVDDGSTDASGAICDSYRERTAHICVVHQRNTGAAAARNTGLRHASGLYVAYIDADDRIAQGSVACLLDWIRRSRADICFLDAIKFYPNGTTKPLGDNISGDRLRNRSKEQVCAYLSSRNKFPGSACTKLFRREFLTKNELAFPVVRCRAEDLFFVRDCIMRAETFDAIHIPYYQYRQGCKGTFAEPPGLDIFWDLVEFIDSSAEMLTADQKALNESSGSLMNFAAYEYAVLLWYYSRFSRELRRELIAPLREYAWVMRFSGSMKTKLTAAMMRILGLNHTAGLLRLYIRLRE